MRKITTLIFALSSLPSVRPITLASRRLTSEPCGEAWTRRYVQPNSILAIICSSIYLDSMPVKQTIPHKYGIFFITITCHKWLPLIEQTNSYDAVYKWFDYLKSKGHSIAGYVIMPNHIHALIAFRNTGQSINAIIGNGKRFMAYDIVKQLETKDANLVLQQLQEAVEEKDRERNKQHEVWSDSFDWKDCRGQEFVQQKLDYIHRNPCRGKWQLASSPEEYQHSSARFYATGEQSAYPVINYRELSDVDLSKMVE